jgi:ABC-2 type transport system permease protein
MLNGLWKLTWLEIKIFLREPLGVVGTLGVPLLVVAVMGRVLTDRAAAGSVAAASFTNVRLPVFAAILVALGEVVSLVTIISLYRESGILKRLRATPLRPLTILTAHVLVKLLLTAVTLGLVLAVGQRYYPIPLNLRLASFVVALLFSTCSILSLGFLVASIVPTARFAQPVASLLLWPMVALSGLFMPLDAMPPLLRAFARALPLTYAASLMEGIWTGGSWWDHLGDIGGLVVVFAVCAAVSARVFRWE